MLWFFVCLFFWYIERKSGEDIQLLTGMYKMGVIEERGFIFETAVYSDSEKHWLEG